MPRTAWSLRRRLGFARAHTLVSFGAGKLTLLLLAALSGGSCESWDNTENPAADSGSGGSGGNGGSGIALGAAAASGGDKQSPKTLNGAFTLSLNAAREATAGSPASDARTSFVGLVNDGKKPSPNAWVEDMKSGTCTLYTPSSPLCDPSCGSSAVCVSENMCEPYPKSQPVGTISLKGVGAAPIEMTPIGSSNNYQPKVGTTLSYPPCKEGDTLRLSVEGGAYSSFELQTQCIAPLDFEGPINLDKGTALKLSWVAPGDQTLTRMQIRLNISHHGGSRGEVRCDVDDNGSLELPSAMVDRLLELGVAGFPTIILTRIASGGAAAGEPANVDFIMQQYIEREIQIAGLESCNGNTSCPSGKTCQTDLTCK
jgi:hypothetical protein